MLGDRATGTSDPLGFCYRYGSNIPSRINTNEGGKFEPQPKQRNLTHSYVFTSPATSSAIVGTSDDCVRGELNNEGFTLIIEITVMPNITASSS